MKLLAILIPSPNSSHIERDSDLQLIVLLTIF
jgi:hypothetical protein